MPRSIQAPTDLTGCILWLDAANAHDDGTGKCDQWNDASGAGNSAAQATPAARPSIARSSAFAGRPVLHFSGAQGMATQAISYGPFSAFVVMRGTVGGIVYEHGSGSASGDYIYSPTGGPTLFVGRSGVQSALLQLSGNPAWGTDNVARVVSTSFAGTHPSHAFFMNEVPYRAVSETANDPGVGTYTDIINIGARNGSSLFLTGDVAEIVLFNRALAPGERVQVEQYLGRKYGLNVGQKRSILSPLELTGCTLWLRGDMGVGYDASSKVATWADQSGNAHDFAQAGTGKPLYVPSSIGGKPALRFDGSTQFLERAFDAGINAAQQTMFAVCAQTGGMGADRFVYASRSSAVTGEVLYVTGNQHQTWFGAGGAGAITLTGSAPVQQGFPVVYAVTLGGIVNALRVSGKAVTQIAAGFSAEYTGPARIGAETIGAANYFWFGDVAEIVQFNRILPPGELLYVERYLGSRYSIDVGAS